MRRFIGAYLVLAAGVLAAGCPSSQLAPGDAWVYDLYEGLDKGYAVAEADDGGFYIVGANRMSIDVEPRVVFAKVDPEMSMEWSILDDSLAPIGAGRARRAYGVTDDEGRLLSVALLVEDRLESAFAALTLLAPDGSVVWRATYQPAGTRGGTPVAAAVRDDRYYTCLRVVKKGAIASGYVASFDKDGALAWDTVFDLDSYLLNLSDMAVGEAGVVAISGSRSEGTGGFDAAVFLFSGDGAYLWGSYFEQAGTQGPGDISVDFAPNGDIVVAGLSTVENKEKPFALRVDREGELVWWKQALREPEEQLNREEYEVYDMVVGADGRIAILGSYRRNEYLPFPFPFFASSTNPFIMQLNPDGSERWYSSFAAEQFPYAFTTTTDDTYMITGTDGNNLALWEMDMEGNVLSP